MCTSKASAYLIKAPFRWPALGYAPGLTRKPLPVTNNLAYYEHAEITEEIFYNVDPRPAFGVKWLIWLTTVEKATPRRPFKLPSPCRSQFCKKKFAARI
jgi:hypothetical protein